MPLLTRVAAIFFTVLMKHFCYLLKHFCYLLKHFCYLLKHFCYKIHRRSETGLIQMKQKKLALFIKMKHDLRMFQMY